MNQNVTQFYDDFASDYTAIFADWEKSVGNQGRILSELLQNYDFPPNSTTVRDVTCGVGTQAFGLALQGYRVIASDLSPQAIVQAEQLKARFDLQTPPTFSVMDLLQPPTSTQVADVVLSADNSIAHFLTEDDLRMALQTMKLHMHDASLLIITLRDYDAFVQEAPTFSPPRRSNDGNQRRVTFQLWDWDEAMQTYGMEQFIMTESENGWQTRSLTSRLRTWQRAEIDTQLAAAGLQNITWHMSEDSGFYQPIVTVTK
ncbi:MAG: class I SAM-dependent methyltransferase [Anaerolineaceae bacterium]|nr:class I SAM-dependent methyltransferase [Anaerolineaceae bacterium]